MSPLFPMLASAAFGFIKGWASNERSHGFRLEQDFIGPVKEELLYRGGPLWLFPNLPMGATAVTFAADHIISDHRNSPGMTPMQVVARLGDVFLGGLAYETAMRGPYGIVGAIGAHMAHNIACSVGQRFRNGALTVGTVAAPEEVLP